MMADLAAFGWCVKARREALDLTQKEVAAAAGCSIFTVRKIEAGVRRPSRQIAELLAACLEIPPAERPAFMRLARPPGAPAPPAGPGADPPAPSGADPAAPARPATAGAPPRGGRRAAPPPPTNLPAFLPAFLGRQGPLAQLCALLWRVDVRLLTLTGAPGIGKTRLAVAAVAALLADFADGAFFVPLAATPSAELVVPAIARALGVRETQDRALEAGLAAHLQSKNLLLLLDNFEHLTSAAPLVAALLHGAPRVKVVVTSRVPLHLYGEYEFPVPPLDLPPADPHAPYTVLGASEAVQLFVKRAEAVQPGFALSPANAPEVAELCRRLDGLPLAIELAAGRAKFYPLTSILARLPHRLDLLAGGAQDLPARHRTVRATIGWSYGLLEPAEAAWFRCLGVFVGGFTAAAGVALLGLPPAPAGAPDGAPEELLSLVDKSLLRLVPPDERTPELRFEMLETIREYALELLQAQGEEEPVRRRHAAYYLALAETAAPQLRGPAQLLWLAGLDAQRANLGAAFEWTLAADPESAGRLAAALGRFWQIRGPLSEGRRWLEAVLTQGDRVAPPVRLQALAAAGRIATLQGAYGPARLLCAAALTGQRAAGDAAGIAEALTGLGIVVYNEGAYAEATQLWREALGLCASLGDRWGRARLLNNLGDSALHQGQYAEATALLEEGGALAQAVGDAVIHSIVLINLGRAALAQGAYGPAAGYFHASLALKQALADAEGLAWCLEGLAAVAAGRAQDEAAARLWGAAERLRESIGAPLYPSDEAAYAAQVATARERLPAPRWAAAWTAGRTEPLADLLAALPTEAAG